MKNICCYLQTFLLVAAIGATGYFVYTEYFQTNFLVYKMKNDSTLYLLEYVYKSRHKCHEDFVPQLVPIIESGECVTRDELKKLNVSLEGPLVRNNYWR